MSAIHKTILGSVLAAAAMIVSAMALKGQPAGDWVESGLMVGFLVFLFFTYPRAMSGKCRRQDRKA